MVPARVAPYRIGSNKICLSLCFITTLSFAKTQFYIMPNHCQFVATSLLIVFTQACTVVNVSSILSYRGVTMCNRGHCFKVHYSHFPNTAANKSRFDVRWKAHHVLSSQCKREPTPMQYLRSLFPALFWSLMIQLNNTKTQSFSVVINDLGAFVCIVILARLRVYCSSSNYMQRITILFSLKWLVQKDNSLNTDQHQIHRTYIWWAEGRRGSVQLSASWRIKLCFSQLDLSDPKLCCIFLRQGWRGSQQGNGISFEITRPTLSLESQSDKSCLDNYWALHSL